MFGSPNVLVTYNARLRRVRVHFLAAECFKHRSLPRSLLKRIESRLVEDKNDGHIETYALFTKRLEALWAHIRSLEGTIEPSREIKLTVGQGGRIYNEIQLKPPKDEGLALLNCQFSSRKMTTIPFNTFVFNIIIKLQELKIEQSPDRAQLRFIYLLLQHGHIINEMPLYAQPNPDDYVRLDKIVRFDKKYKYATLHILDPRWLQSEEGCERLLKESLIDLRRLNSEKVKLVLLNKHSLEKLKSMISKMQAYGFQMPYDLLIAYDAEYRLDAGMLRREKNLSQHDKADLPRWKMRLGALMSRPQGDYFQVEIDSSGMHATIRSVEKLALAKVRNSIDLDGLSRELEKQRIVYGYENFLEPLWQQIQKGGSIIGLTVAEGLKPQTGQQVTLHMLNKEERGKDSRDVREGQNKRLVQKGELVAELRYADGVEGITVEGKPSYAHPPTSASKYVAGDGIVYKEGRGFYATRDGLIVVEGDSIRCDNVYVHKGSINLSSGNLGFDGAVMVEGDIEAGAEVQVNGNLTVTGMVSSAKVRCSGDLEVKGGIVTGEQGYVRVGGNLKCSFMENSIIQVKGDLSVTRSIMNCHVVAGGAIVITDGDRALVAGGSISSWSAIRVGRCGLQHGQATECRIGSHYLSELRLLRLKQRIKKMETYHEQLLKAAQVMESSTRMMLPAQKIEFQTLQDKIKRSKRIKNRLIIERDSLDQKMAWNLNATLVVTGILDKNVSIIAAGRNVPVTGTLKGILVPAAPFHGNQLLDLSSVDAFKQANPDALLP